MSSGPGYPSNLFSCPGEISPQDSIARITEALCMGRETLNKTLRLYEVGVKKCAQCNCKNSSHFLSKPITDSVCVVALDNGVNKFKVVELLVPNVPRLQTSYQRDPFQRWRQ